MSAANTQIENKRVLVPKLRFKEFKSSWIRKKIDEVSELTSSKRVYLSDYVNQGIPFFRGKEISELKKGIVPSDILYITETAYNDFKDKYGVPQKNDILMTAVGTLGNVLRITNDKKFYFKDGNLIWFRKISESSEFLEILLEVKNVDIEKTSIGSTQRALTMVELRKLVFPFPTLPEQQKIASFLSAVDEKIRQLTRKKELLEQYKKGVMQQLFSGELRFKDENGKAYPKWEEKKLGEVLEIGSGRDYKHLGQGSIPVFGTGGLMTMVDDFLYDGETVCIGRKGTIHRPMFHNGKIWTVDTLFYTHSFENVLPKYVYYVFQRINWIEHNEASGVPSLSKTTIEKLRFKLPYIEEQQKIASFLSSIDAKIDGVATQIAQTQMFKKGLLQQMFV